MNTTTAGPRMEWNGITHRVVSMTPEIAADLLRRNSNNRPIRDVITNNYLADMRAGKWKYAGDPIRLDEDGTLLDGQHRLTAMAAMPSGWSAPVLLIEGLPTSAQLVMDQGRKRSPGQQLHLLGYANAHYLAGTVRVLIEWRDGLMFRDTSQQAVVTTARIQEFVEANPHIAVLVNEARQRVISCYMTPSVVAAFYIEAASIDKEIADEFITQLAEGTGLEPGSPILALRERAIRGKAERRKDSERNQLGLLIRTWNLHWGGQTVTRMQLPKGGTFTADTFPTMLR